MTPAEMKCKQFDQLRGNRANLDSYFQTLHDYFLIEAENINKTYYQGTELDFDYLYDTTALSVANILPAGIANYMTPFSSHWATLRHKDPVLNANQKVRTWMKDAEDEIFYTLSGSNFYDQIMPFYKDTSIYGTSVMLTEADNEDIVRFYSLPIKQVYIVEDARQRVNEYFIELEYTADQAVGKFGLDKVGEKIRETYNAGEKQYDKKYKFIMYIGPRHERNVTMTDNLNMPIEALWIDYTDRKEVKESGYEIMPAFTHRFYKRASDPYGFSPAMMALADNRWLQAISKTELQSTMSKSLPAWALPNNAFILPMDLGNNALNFYTKGTLTKDDIFRLGTEGDVNVNEMMYEKKLDALKEHMFYDVFLAFQGITKQMTVPEVMQRAQERMTLLGPAVGRLQDSLASTFHITLANLFKADRLPELPDELVGDPTYEIEYTSVLSLAQKSSDMQALQKALGMAGEMANYKPDIIDNINFDKTIRSVWDIAGADPSVLVDKNDVIEIRQGRAEQEAQERQQLALAQGAQTLKTGSEAAKNIREASA
jgi:hypothetical protein